MKKFTKLFALVLVATLVSAIIGINPIKASDDSKVITVSTQKAFMKEIAKKSAATIILETKSSNTITLKSSVSKTKKRAKNKTIVIDAPNAKIINYLNYKNLTLKNAKSISERVNGNKIDIQNENIKLYVYKNITIKDLTIPEATQISYGKKSKITNITETAKPTDIVIETPAEQSVPVYYDANGKMYYVYYDYDTHKFHAEFEAENFVISESDIVYPAGWQWPIPIN